VFLHNSSSPTRNIFTLMYSQKRNILSTLKLTKQMIYIAPTSVKNRGAFVDVSLGGVKSRLKAAASLEVTSKSS